MSIDIHVPNLGESVADATIARWLHQPGEAVRRDEVIAELETEKITVEVTAPADGAIAVLHAAQGESVLPGALLATLRVLQSGDRPPAPAAAAAAPRPASAAPTPLASGPAALPPRRPEAEPATKDTLTKLVILTPRGAKVPLERSLPTSASQPGPAATAALTGRERRVPLGALRTVRAQRLKEAQAHAAMITTFNDVDLSQVDQLIAAHGAAFRDRHGAELDRMAFIVRGCVHALEAVPHVNGRIEDETIVQNLDMHIAVPIETAAGLVMPVLRRAGELGLGDIAVALADLRSRAEAGTLSVAELQGGTFSIADAGPFGALLSVPILATPQSGVLGVHRAENRPVAIAGVVAVRPMMYVSLSYDHRLIDGRESVTFLVRLKAFLQAPEPFLL